MTYPIGQSGIPWTDQEKQLWFENQSKKRSYDNVVVAKIRFLAETKADRLELIEYGTLPYAELNEQCSNYPLFLFKSSTWNNKRRTVLITGGVHGYETSGILGALLFIEDALERYGEQFNFVIAPCVSPWGFETINRWNPAAIDPNRSFYSNSPAPESAHLLDYLTEQGIKPWCHIDLHETTDTDNSEFRPALAARDAIEQKSWNIPDGFYAVGDTQRPAADFQTAVIKSVEQVTHIAPADENDQLIGVPLEQFGVINYACKQLGLCAGLSNAEYVTTTEVYPDSLNVDDDACNQAQVAAIAGALDFLIVETEIRGFLNQLEQQPDSVEFDQIMALIDSVYDFKPTAFRNGELDNQAGENNGSCKILSFACLHQLTKQQALACFGQYYRNDVLSQPDDTSHGNIRNLLRFGLSGVSFDGQALVRK